MIEVINQESLVTPLPFYEKKKKKKTHTATKTPPSEKVPTKDSDKTSQSSQAKLLIPNIQRDTYNPLLRYFVLHSLRVLIANSLCLGGKPTDPNDSEENKQPVDMTLPATHLDKGISTTQPLPEGTNTNPKDSERLKPLVDRDSSNPFVISLLGTNAQYQVDVDTIILTIVADIQALLGASDDELKDDSDDNVFEARDEINEDIQQVADEEETQSPEPSKEPSTEIPIEEHEKYEEATNSYADLRTIVEDYYKENVDHKSHTDKLVKKTMNRIEKIKLEVANEEEHVQEPQVSEQILITIVKALTKPTPELEMIISSSRLQITDTILKILIPQPKTKITGSSLNLLALCSPPKLVKASRKLHSDPDTSMRVPYEIHGKTYQLTKEEIQAHFEKEEKLEKATRKARLNKPELIKVVHKEATKSGVDPKALASKEGGQEFIKIQDAEIKFLNREHSKKIKKSREL
nr:hypothetical protein [Tanacetum cinerariifolium]